MTHNEFIKRYQGQYIDFDGAFGAQCMDLYRQYVKDVLEVRQSPPVVGAKDVWNTHTEDFTKEKYPIQGDIVIWRATESNPYGHIAVFHEGTKTLFTSFDQNYPIGSPCHLQTHTSKDVIGFLRCAKIKDMDSKERQKYEDQIRALNTEIGRVTKERDDALKYKKEYYRNWQLCLDSRQNWAIKWLKDKLGL